MVIENKIHSVDQASQLRRYWEFVRIEAQGHRLSPIVVYLTPDGRAPTAQSMGEGPDFMNAVIRLSYHDDIYEFIQSTAEITKAVSVAEILRQYAKLTKRLT
jgi:hypothetical protein